MKLSFLLGPILLAFTTFAAPRSKHELARRTTIFPLQGQASTLAAQSRPARRIEKPFASSLERDTNNPVEYSLNVRKQNSLYFLYSFSKLLSL
jgi:hypothetical protein